MYARVKSIRQTLTQRKGAPKERCQTATPSLPCFRRRRALRVYVVVHASQIKARATRKPLVLVLPCPYASKLQDAIDALPVILMLVFGEGSASRADRRMGGSIM